MKKIKKTILTGLLSLSFMGTVLVFYPQEAKAACDRCSNESGYCNASGVCIWQSQPGGCVDCCVPIHQIQ